MSAESTKAVTILDPRNVKENVEANEQLNT